MQFVVRAAEINTEPGAIFADTAPDSSVQRSHTYSCAEARAVLTHAAVYSSPNWTYIRAESGCAAGKRNAQNEKNGTLFQMLDHHSVSTTSAMRCWLRLDKKRSAHSTAS
jgi:hypothetical protein